MNDWAGLIWLVLLLLGNAFFVAAEFAVMSARRSQIEPLAEAGSGRAQTTLRAMENVSLMLACAQLGITVCSLLILQVAESSQPARIQRPLIRTLEMSCEKFAQGQLDKGVELLEAFQHKVGIQLWRIDRALAERLINAAQTIIDAIPPE